MGINILMVDMKKIKDNFTENSNRQRNRSHIQSDKPINRKNGRRRNSNPTKITYNDGKEVNKEHDPVGNMESEKRVGVGIYKDDTTSNYAYDKADKLTKTITYKGLDITSSVYTHDTAGNITNDGIYTYAYDVGNRVILKYGKGEMN